MLTCLNAFFMLSCKDMCLIFTPERFVLGFLIHKLHDELYLLLQKNKNCINGNVLSICAPYFPLLVSLSDRFSRILEVDTGFNEMHVVLLPEVSNVLKCQVELSVKCFLSLNIYTYIYCRGVNLPLKCSANLLLKRCCLHFLLTVLEDAADLVVKSGRVVVCLPPPYSKRRNPLSLSRCCWT